MSVPAALTFSSAASAATQDTTALTVVSDSTTATAAGWAPQAYDCDPNGDWTDPTQSFALSAGAPLGQGAAFFTMGALPNQTELYRNTTLDSTKLADVSDLGYSTYQHATRGTVAKQPAYLRLTVDRDGDGSQIDSLYFEPALNPEQGAITQDAWQSWDAGKSANWTTTGDASGLTTLSAYQSAHPDAKIVNNSDGSGPGNFGGLALIAGCSGQNQTYAQIGVDRVTVTSGGKTSLWDFETPAGVNTSRTETVKTATGSWNESAWNYGGNAGAGSSVAIAQSFVLGPKLPVLGKGSREITIGDNSDVTEFWRSTALDGKKVDTLRKLGYSTYAEHVAGKAGSELQQPAYLRLSIDSDGPDAHGAIVKDTTLNFEPANNADQHGVLNGAWQTWNAFAGQFHVIEGPGETADGMITLASYMARHPKAVFAENAKAFGGKGALSLVVGSAGDNQRNGRFAVDNVSVGLSSLNAGKPAVASTVYDFEPTYTVPTANNAKRVGAGMVTLTGRAGAGDRVEVRTYKAGTYSTVAGTATANQSGSWSLVLPVRERVYFRAYLAGTYGTTNITSATHQVDVQFGVGLALSTSRGYTYGTVALNPALRSVPVRLETVVNHRWVTVAKGVTASNGKATLKWDSARGRGYTVRAVAGSTGTVLGNYSASRWVRSS
ncbi:MAG TPA: hypothetical protein VFK66_13420 [Oryzihumus sp.]|nr:hypothetical protein [Oryzihumus sp.]